MKYEQLLDGEEQFGGEHCNAMEEQFSAGASASSSALLEYYLQTRTYTLVHRVLHC